MHSPAVGDIDGDGHPELLVTDRETVWVFDVDPAGNSQLGDVTKAGSFAFPPM
ncbi:MAG: hypothetical protein QGG05_06460 [Candidatus Latescibacteria bacterium]|nr:hypothetical protein [Candidatus Latescibacterota bacterium]